MTLDLIPSNSDFPKQQAASQIVGKLWSLCLQASKQDGSIDLFNEDAIHFARAYKNAMDVQKHGGAIYLPQHLHEHLSPSQQELVTAKH